MEQLFNQLSETLLNNLNAGEHLKVAIGGENSQFVRFSQSKVRQSGLVDDASLSIVLIKDDHTCSGSFTLTGNIDIDEATAMEEMNRLRTEVGTLPKDPFVVMPEDTGSSQEEHNGSLLNDEEAVSALSPAMQGDLAGIWASGRIFSGNANSAGQKHWFATDTYSLDYSLISPDERKIKGTFDGRH